MTRAALPLVAALAVLAAGGPARADRRSFGWTYEYQTMPEGGLDLEIWATQIRPAFGDPLNGYELASRLSYLGSAPSGTERSG